MNNEFSPNLVLCARIAELRRASGMTQDALAEKLGVTFQAISKWENALSCPDISLLPRIAEIFDVSIDSLFGADKKPEHEPEATLPAPSFPISDVSTADTPALPWEDDGKLRAVLFIGTRRVGDKEYNKEKTDITFHYEGDALDVISDFSISCNSNIRGNATATSGPINCEGDIKGNASTGFGAIICEGNIEGDAATGNGNINCDGDIEGDAVTGNGKIDCGDIGGDVATGNGNIDCGDIGGDVATGNGNIDCGDVGGSITVKNTDKEVKIDCGNVGGDIKIDKGSIDCGDVDGNITVNQGTVDCGDVDGSVTAQTIRH